MTKLYFCAFLLVAATAACGDDTGSTGKGGAGGDDPVVTVAGSGGHPGCNLGDTLPCSCADGTEGSKTCENDQLGDTSFSDCENNGGKC